MSNIYKVGNNFKIINDDSLNMLNYIEENSIDAIVCYPPYELGFMGKKWDSSGIAYNVELWEKALKVLKPGGHLLAFGGTRTYHRIACAIEDAGFEIRDCIMWLYGSGFPKSQNVGAMVEGKCANTKDFKKLNGELGQHETLGFAKNQYEQGIRPTDYNETSDIALKKLIPTTEEGKKWNGWGTALKPAYEPCIVARKPIDGTVANNCIKWGVGALNIEDCRIGTEVMGGGTMQDLKEVGKITGHKMTFAQEGTENCARIENPNTNIGRFPANVITDGSEEVASGMPNTKSNESGYNFEFVNQDNPSHLYTNIKSGVHFADEGSALRYFYSAKASKKDRDEGLDILEEKERNDGCERSNAETSNKFGCGQRFGKNIHPTVKPVELMQYLVRLVAPKGATVLDIFNGSGSTGKAVAFENRERNANYKYIGIELSKEYCEISKMRIEYGLNKYQYDMDKDIKEEEKATGQMSLFDL